MDIPYQQTSDSQTLLWYSFTDVPVIQQNTFHANEFHINSA